jgi:hypothetical protein
MQCDGVDSRYLSMNALADDVSGQDFDPVHLYR